MIFFDKSKLLSFVFFQINKLIFAHIIYLTIWELFNAAHRLLKKEWTDEGKIRVFGKSYNPNWHDQNYELFITIKGEINPETGFTIK